MRLGWFFAFFLVSGFCSLVYQVVWLRLAMARYGVTAPMISIVLSVFMVGLALGSWGAGRLTVRWTSPAGPLRFYGVAEVIIAASALVVPAGLAAGPRLLAAFGGEAEWGSLAHYAGAGTWVALVLLPFCTSMGATVPLAMRAIVLGRPDESRSFSYLYVANVLGATLGTLASAFVLIELLGFYRTQLLMAALNAALGLGAFALSFSLASTPREGRPPKAADSGAPAREPLLGVLFGTGLASMGMEVVWVRQFTPYLGSVVYAFAIILALYLAANLLGSMAYRRLAGRVDPWAGPVSGVALLGLAAVLGLLPLLAADPRLGTPLVRALTTGAARVALGVAPFCVVVGFLTPLAVDRWSGGDAAHAGRAYAVNVLGCILGPLLAGFVLLPHLGERWALVALSLPLLALGARAVNGPLGLRGSVTLLAVVAAAALLVGLTRDYETLYGDRRVRRDYTATVIAVGMEERRARGLLVNGVGMTGLTQPTKLMAHLPLAFLDSPPSKVLVICFGMGTSFRSALTWNARVVAVELVPSVPRLFEYYHADGAELLRLPQAAVVIDDGRRFLERSRDSYDVVVVDPPPPPEAAGSSLLYSREFCSLVRKRLRPGGILQQWLPGGDLPTWTAVSRALTEAFPHVRCFRSVGNAGVHYLASDRPLPRVTAATLAARLPPSAARDLVEWGPQDTAEEQLEAVLGRELPVESLILLSPDTPALTDDRPVNEYYYVRRWFHPTPRRSDPWSVAPKAE